ncbi:Aste57867_8763 [Aphanomyces stellatus]|uniref:HECT-type E3 ubiquitin transferase n=1 Tax=Aphanomyces stellatus TaxID=120398 RepID=A0A485KL69_9STRA|nr:hypothetical protein As57867_008729 [Aphanomyces stellatus]VFT85649.1 Aste57867_8763 [Aphanomyces stellatus]
MQPTPCNCVGLLGQLGTDMPMFGANPQYRAILEKIKPSNPTHVQMASLSELVELLSMTSEEVLTISGFSIDAYVPVLTAIIATPPSMEILLLACRCLAAILDIFSSPNVIELAVSNNLIASLCDKMLNIEYMDVAEVALRMLERIASSNSADTREAVLQENGIVALLQFVDFFAVDVQRTAARTAALLCSDVEEPAWFQLQMGLFLIQTLTRSFDAEIVYQGCDSLKRLCESPCVQDDPTRLAEIVDAAMTTHLLTLFTTYTDDRVPENMKPTTYPVLLHLFALLLRHNIDLAAAPAIDRVLCSILSTQSSPSLLLQESLDFIDALVAAGVAHAAYAPTVAPLVAKTLPLMLHACDSMAQDLRAQVVDVMYQMTTFLAEKALGSDDHDGHNTRHETALCKFVASALSRRAPASDQEMSLALYIVSLALQHDTHGTFHARFVRDGVVEALRTLSQSPLVTTEVQQAVQILKMYFGADEDTTSVLTELVAIVAAIKGDPEMYDAPLAQLGQLLGRDTGVTPYELSKSRLVPALTQLLATSPDATHAFRQEIFAKYEASWLLLIRVVHETIAGDMETAFQEPATTSHVVCGVASTVGMVELLGQHLKIRLNVAACDNDDDASGNIPQDTVVLVEPLARVETMEEFVGEKLFGKSAKGSDQPPAADEDMPPVAAAPTKKLRATYQGQALSPATSILEVLVKARPDLSQKSEFAIKSLWEGSHELAFHVVEADDNASLAAPPSLATTRTSPALLACLDLLKLLFNMSLPVAPTVFVNASLSTQVKRSLMQPLLVAIQAFPAWCNVLVTTYAFLLPLDTKLHFLYASAFGPARAIQYLSKSLWKQEALESTEGRSRRTEAAALSAAVTRVAKIPRLKVRVARSKLLQSAIKLLSAYGGQKAIIEIEYLGEVGTGLGPTTEFFSLVSQEIQAQHLNLWRHDGPEPRAAAPADESKPDETAAAVHPAMPIRGYHRIAVVHCTTCGHIYFPTCSVHDILLTQSNDKSTKMGPSTEPQCALCVTHPTWTAPSCHNTSCENGAVRWLWWIVSEHEVEYLSKAYPRAQPSVVHPVLQCSHCDTVNFPGTDAGIVTMEGDRMVSRSGRRMYERDYRAVTKHVSALCEGTPLVQANIVLLRSHVEQLVDLVPKCPEVLDSEIDGLGIDSSFTADVVAVHAPHGLYPKPLIDPAAHAAVVPYFEFLGNLVAQALLDERLLDLPFAVPFLRSILGEDLHSNLAMALHHITVLDPAIGRSLTYLYDHSAHADVIDAMGLTFELVGTSPPIPLRDGGADCAVTSVNVLEYLELTATMLLHTSIQAQSQAFRYGFAAIAPLPILTMLSAADWSLLLADPTRQLWPGGADEIRAAMVCDHGYTAESQAIQWLVEILVDLSPAQQTLFVRFVTGSHRLPLGGLAKLEPALTVVRKLPSDDSSGASNTDLMLPSASTCTNYLKLPDYSTKDVMRAKLLYCIEEGQLSFHLS